MKRPGHDRVPAHRGFTLIEAMAVIIMLSLAGGLAGGALIGAQTHADSQRMLAGIVQLDRLARIHARTAGPARMVFVPDRAELQLIAIESGVIVRSVRLPASTEIELLGSPSEHAVRFDRSGRSDTYSVTLRHPDGGELTELRITGDTGLIRQTWEGRRTAP